MATKDKDSTPNKPPAPAAEPKEKVPGAAVAAERREAMFAKRKEALEMIAVPKDGGKLKISELAEMAFPGATTGNHVNGVRASHPVRWMHASAVAMHRWTQHAHHEAKEMELTPEDYGKAIEAACVLDSKGHTKPHKPALYTGGTPKA